jgi:hypothetical protein
MTAATARTSATWMTSACMTSAWTSSTRSPTGMADPRMSTRAPADPYPAWSATVPSTPSRAAAPAKAAAECITAPIEAGTTPAVVIPAVISSAEDELSLFHIAGDRRWREAIDGKSVGLTNRA